MSATDQLGRCCEPADADDEEEEDDDDDETDEETDGLLCAAERTDEDAAGCDEADDETLWDGDWAAEDETANDCDGLTIVGTTCDA